MDCGFQQCSQSVVNNDSDINTDVEDESSGALISRQRTKYYCVLEKQYVVKSTPIGYSVPMYSPEITHTQTNTQTHTQTHT